MDKGLDDVDGAVFSRIPSKQSDIDKFAQTRVQKQGKPGSTVDDHVDGALFSRIPSQKNDLKNATNGQEHIARHIDGGKETQECTIKPEDLDDENEAGRDDMIQEVNEPLLGETSPNHSSTSFNESNSSVYDDMSDAIQGSRVSLNHMNTEEEGTESQPVSASVFYSEAGQRQDISENNANGIDLYLSDSETEGIKSSDNLNNVKQTGCHTTKEENTSKGHNRETRESISRISNENVSSEDRTYSSARAEDDADKIKNTATTEKDKIHESKLSLIWRLVKALAFPIISLVIYIVDIGSDIHLAVSYRGSGDFDLFWITLGCIVIPHILMAVVDVSWVWLDRKKKNCRRFILGFLTLGRIARALTYMRHIYLAKMLPKVNENEMQECHTELEHVKKRSWHKDRARDEKRDCFMLDFINAFAESAPQLFVQLYLYYANNLELSFLRVWNLLSSWISIAWTYAAYYRCNREALKGEQDVKIAGFSFFFVAVMSALAARYICTTLFLVNFNLLIGTLCIFFHFIFMFFWIVVKERPELEGTAHGACGRSLYYVFFAYVCILCFMNLNDTRARVRMTVFYVLIYVENIIMAGLVLWKLNETGSEKSIHLIILPVGCIIHVVLLVVYYTFLHPKTGLCYNCDVPKNSLLSIETPM